jgi:DNA-binding transcriptional LysR family regulator
MIALRYEVFLEVASILSFSKAADSLCISQPAVSKQIKILEAEMNVALFERKGNMISMTHSGKKLYGYMLRAKTIQRQILSDEDIIKKPETTRGELKIGASTTISLYIMPKILSSFHNKFPKVKMILINRNSENVLNALINHEIDLAIVEAYHQVNAVYSKAFINDEIIPICSKNSPYGQSEIRLEEIKDIPIALRERGSGTLSVLKKELETNKIKLSDLNVIAHLGGTEALKNFLLADKAVGFLSRWSVEKELGNGELRQINIKSLKVDRKFNFVMRKGEESTGLIRNFIKESKLLYNVRL